MPALYTHYFADARHSGFEDAVCKASGDVAWARRIGFSEEERARARVVLVHEDRLVVEGMEALFSFDRAGEPRWRRPKWYGSKTVLGDGLVYYTSPERQDWMEAVDLDNRLRFERYPLPDLFEKTYFVLFEPSGMELYAQVQYPDTADASAREIIVYRFSPDRPGYVWSRIYTLQQSPVQPLLSLPHGRLLTTTLEWDALVFHTDQASVDAEPAAIFPCPFRTGPAFVSCGLDGLLYWSGLREARTTLAVTDFEGNPQWEWQAPGFSLTEPEVPLAPPLLGPEGPVILTPRGLYAVAPGGAGGGLSSAEEQDFTFATVLADGSCLVAAGNELLHLRPGEEPRFRIGLDDPIVAPPVVDSGGMAFAAGSETLYAIQ